MNDHLKYYVAGKLVLESMDLLDAPRDSPAARKAREGTTIAYYSLNEAERAIAHDFQIGLTEVILRFEKELATLKKV